MTSNSSAPKGEFIVQNWVSNCTLLTSLDCQQVVEALHGRWCKGVFPAVVSACKETGTTNSCFATSQIVISGAKSELQALLSAYLLIARLSHDLMRTDLQLYNYGLQNIVCNTSLGYELNLDLFAQRNKSVSEYNPEMFAGLHYRTHDPDIGFVIFSTGTLF